MATLVSSIIEQAFREGNFIAVGEVPTTAEQGEALPRLRNLLSSLFGFELGEQLRDWFVPSNYAPESPLRYPLTPAGISEPSAATWAYPTPNVQLVVNVAAASTLYFPATPDDGARMSYIDMGSAGVVTLSGNGRKIEGAATLTAGAGVLALDGRKWLYRADLANWIRIDVPLELDSEVPLPPEFDDLLVAGLAVIFAPRFQVAPSETTRSRFTDMLSRLKARYKQTERMPLSPDLYRTMNVEL